MGKYLTEAIGTFFLVLTIGCTVLAGSAMAPLAIGAVLMVMVFAGGHISGAHYNPAITLGVWMRGRLGAREVVPYWISQIVGAALAAWVVGMLRPDAQPVPMTLSLAPMFVAELVFTFALVFTVLTTATAKATSGNSFYGLAIGFSVTAGAFAVGDISGAAFNPAVSVGISMLGLVSWSSIWLYLAAQLIAAALAVFVFRMTHADDR